MNGYIHYPVVTMREAPNDSSRVVSQALFGELVEIQDRFSGNWAHILTPDRYAGWIQANAIVMRQEVYPQDLETTRLATHIYAAPDTEYGPLITLPYGSPLQLLDSSDPRWHQICLPSGRPAFVQKGDTLSEPLDLPSFVKKFLGVPYTWGGRSSFGYDCSGFVQMVYQRLHRPLPRDAKQQILICKPVETPMLGDLIFWGKSKEEIKHVGMFLEGEQFIHTSVRENRPYLRLSNLSEVEWSGDKLAFYPFREIRRV